MRVELWPHVISSRPTGACACQAAPTVTRELRTAFRALVNAVGSVKIALSPQGWCERLDPFQW